MCVSHTEAVTRFYVMFCPQLKMRCRIPFEICPPPPAVPVQTVPPRAAGLQAAPAGEAGGAA